MHNFSRATRSLHREVLQILNNGSTLEFVDQRLPSASVAPMRRLLAELARHEEHGR